MSILVVLLVAITLVKIALAYSVRHKVGFDEYWHLILIDDIRKNGLFNSAEHTRFIKPSTLTVYPWFFHWLISFLPAKSENTFGYLINPVIDIAFIVALYQFMLLINVEPTGAMSICLMYAFSPIMFSALAMGPRISALTPRLFGEIVGMFYFLFLYQYVVTQDLIWGGLGLCFGIVVVLSSKFSIQAMLFISMVIGVLLMNLVIFILPFVAIFCSMLLTRFRNKETLIAQLDHLTNYAKQNFHGKMSVSDRASLKPFFVAFKNRDISKLVNLFVSRHPLSSALIKIPHVFVACILVMFTGEFTQAEIFFIAGFSVYVLTSTRLFLFLGESERYLLYISPFAYLIIWHQSVTAMPEIFWTLIVYGIIYMLFEIAMFVIKSKARNQMEENNDILINELNKYQKPLNIVTIPYHLGGWRIIYDTVHNHLHYTWWNNKDDIVQINEYTLKYPYLDLKQIKTIKQVYDIDKIYVLKSALIPQMPEGINISPVSGNSDVVEVII